jgi:hypothetical protein
MLKKKCFQILVLGFGLFLFGCKEVAIKDGRIPKEHLKHAKTIEGRYVGSFNGKKAEMNLFLHGDRPKLKYQDSSSYDILGTDCQSKIGDLKTVWIDQSKAEPTLERMEFALNPGQCAGLVEGRRVILRFLRAHRFEARILEFTEVEDECDPRFPPPREGDLCGKTKVPYYLEGLFNKYR